MEKMPYKWKLKEFLEANRITTNALAEEIGENVVTRTTVYKFVKNPSGAKVSTLEAVLDGLTSILKEPVDLSKIAEFEVK